MLATKAQRILSSFQAKVLIFDCIAKSNCCTMASDEIPLEIRSKRAILTLSIVGFFGLFTFIMFMLVNFTVFWSKSSGNVSKGLKWFSFVACVAANVVVIIDGLTIFLTLDGLDVGDSVLINFGLPFSAFILKLFVYLIFVGQIYALKRNDVVYRTRKMVLVFICVLLVISIVCVLVIMILEPMIALNARNVELIKRIYKWDILALHINELILSISVIVIFIKKLIIAIRSEQRSQLNNSGVKFVDEGVSYRHVKAISGDNEAEHEYKYMKTGSKMKETNPVHIMVRLVLLSSSCILWVELLFVTLLMRRVWTITYDTNAFQVVRCIESFCAAMASMCIYLHFAANFKIYDCLCSCCHNCCLGMCVKCTCVGTGRNQNDGLELGDVDNDYKELPFMNT
eukprot:86111_1